MLQHPYPRPNATFLDNSNWFSMVMKTDVF